MGCIIDKLASRVKLKFFQGFLIISSLFQRLVLKTLRDDSDVKSVTCYQ